MKFSTAFLAAATTLFFSQGALAEILVAQVVGNIKNVTAVSQNASDVLSSLSTSTSPSDVETMSTTLANDFNTIITSLAADVKAMDATSAFNDADAGPVVDALSEFVEVHQALLATVIGKHSIFAQFFLTAPIVAVLRNLEAGIDDFAYSMIDLIPTRESNVTTDKNSLHDSVGNTITKYQEPCVPSLLYPFFMPLCVSTS
ncbi:hypothetical protein MSAN_02260600 [Mycena sanguinolenta]|uniref:Uncharacterized protein n=1 Tax=Mycena sanguinolenta TaxID=230812 RepID=A0A8H6XAU5_9AGAR|nr:hypothetical protein MSAN_02260600 [Mycena sanguinolenta]